MATLPRIGIALTALLLVAAAALFVFRVAFSDRIYPAVAVGDVPVGGLSVGEAENKLTARATELETGTFAFSLEGKTWAPTLSELGATIDVDSSLAEARQLGRTGDASDRLSFTGELIRGDKTVPLKTTVNRAALNVWFDKVDADINHPAIDADIVVQGGSATISPDATGVIVDRDLATAQILSALQNLEPVHGALPTIIEQPEIRAADLEANYDEISAALKQPINVTFEGNNWKIDPASLTQYLTVTTAMVDGRADVQLAMNTDDLASSLNGDFAPQVNREPVDATVAWSNGAGLIALSNSMNGITLSPEKFAGEVSSSFLGGNKSFELPVVVTKPDIDSNNLGALGITSELGTGDSDFANGEAARDTNIEVGISLLNGTLVKPGEDFSFNGAIGEITADKGYVESGVIVAERVGRDIGGGICQVSTTTFRAALLAGMPIGEWNPHSYRLKGYEVDGWGPGFDASILQEGSDPQWWGDFTFTNNTPGWLLVSSWTDYPKAYVRIYGTDDGRTVNVGEVAVGDPIINDEDIEVVSDSMPAGTIEQTEWPQEGVEVGFDRTVLAKDGSVMDERWFSSPYGGRGNVYTVSADMEGQSPAAGGGG